MKRYDKDRHGYLLLKAANYPPSVRLIYSPFSNFCCSLSNRIIKLCVSFPVWLFSLLSQDKKVLWSCVPDNITSLQTLLNSTSKPADECILSCNLSVLSKFNLPYDWMWCFKNQKPTFGWHLFSTHLQHHSISVLTKHMPPGITQRLLPLRFLFLNYFITTFLPGHW